MKLTKNNVFILAYLSALVGVVGVMIRDLLVMRVDSSTLFIAISVTVFLLGLICSGGIWK